MFNTEAHPLDSAAIHCCSAEKKAQDEIIQHFHDNVDLLALLGLVEPKMDVFSSPKKKPKRKTVKPKVQQHQQSQVTIKLDQNVKVENTEIKNTEEKDSGRIRLPLPVSGKDNKNEFENRVKKLLQDVRLSPSTRDDVVDRILNTLKDAVKTAQPSSEVSAEKDKDPKVTDSQIPEINSQADQTQSAQSNQDTPNLKEENVKEIDEKIEKNTDNLKDNVNSETQSDKNLDDEDMCSAKEKNTEENIDKLEEEFDDEDTVEARLLTCPAQPFYMRLSIMGEMFMPRL